jgi:hypothetical protein
MNSAIYKNLQASKKSPYAEKQVLVHARVNLFLNVNLFLLVNKFSRERSRLKPFVLLKPVISPPRYPRKFEKIL